MRPASGRRVARLLRHELVEGIVGTAVFLVANHLGWAGGFSDQTLVALLTPALLMQSSRVQRWLAGGDLRNRLAVRMALHLGVGVTLVAYVTGFGPLVTAAYVVATVSHLRWSGARAWRLAVPFTIAGSTLGQGAIRLGLVENYLPEPVSFVAWFLTLFLSLVVIRQLGLAFASREEADARTERAQAAARSQARRFRSLVQNSTDVITVVDAAGLITFTSPSARLTLGHPADDMVGRRAFFYVDAADRPVADALTAAVFAEPLVEHRAEMRFRHVDGQSRWHEVVAVNLLDDPDVAGVILNQRDIDIRHTQRQMLEYRADHDALTGLANRAALHKALDQALARPEPAVAVLFLDLDGFKPINDSYGHEAGDALLVEIAARLRGIILGTDNAFRVGGDEFVLLIGGVRQTAGAVSVADRAITALSQPIYLATAEVTVGVSIGIALSNGASDGGDLLRMADEAMYAAKSQGKNRWATVSADMVTVNGSSGSPGR
ncbi:diguanylate cyclase domain-containing protein [Actinoplanes sp. NPDC049265]|uniref:diguanylate cyclase domain-containing protein n=1 Tax=Actinoplanes sp. NPDC049265 TaxID=3363902 RepID=UPI003716D367